MNARRGRIYTFTPHSFAAADTKDQTIIRLPLTIHNTGAKPCVIQNLRLQFPTCADLPSFPWRGSRQQIMPEEEEKFDFPAVFAIPGRTAVQHVSRDESQSTRGSTPQFAAPNDAAKARREETQERVLNMTAKHSFNRLYDQLRQSLIDPDVGTDSLRRGAPVEVVRDFEPSPITEMIDNLFELIRMMQEFDMPQLQDAQLRQSIAMMSALLDSTGERRKSVPMVSEGLSSNHAVIFIAEASYILVDREEFFGEMTLVGKVRKIVPEGQHLDLLDLINIFPRAVRRSAAAGSQLREGIINLFANWPKELGPSLDRDALNLAGPALIVDPLAVFT